ncbi:MAG: hypothetical protein ABIL01_31225 [Pseudomonadota bacterium]
MASPESTFSSAGDAYIRGDNPYAIVLFHRAAEEAREYRDVTLWFRATVWEAEATYSISDLRRAYSLVLMASAEEPPGCEFEHWLCRKLRFKIFLDWEPIKRNLREILEDLEKFQRSADFSEHDLHFMHAHLSAARGAWAESLAYCESGIAVYDDDRGGFKRIGFAYLALECCILLRRIAAAEDWIKAIRSEVEWNEGWNRSIEIYQAAGRLKLARARREPVAEIRRLFREFDDLCRTVGDAEMKHELYCERVRTGLLDPDEGDPSRLVHPSRNACRNFSPKKTTCHSRFDHSLLVLDYRIACLRFIVGIHPIDDEFYEGTPPLEIFGLFDKSRFDQQLNKVRSALRCAQVRAVKLDLMLECDWRTNEIQKRAAWISAIGSAEHS